MDKILHSYRFDRFGPELWSGEGGAAQGINLLITKNFLHMRCKVPSQKIIKKNYIVQSVR